jgi:DNA-binding GntR family transcriptional regulator
MRSGDRIPDGVLKKIFPKKFNRATASETVYMQLKQMIISEKLKKGRKLSQGKMAQDFSVSQATVAIAFSQLKKDGLVICKKGIGSFIV